MSHFLAKKWSAKGFTLIELLVVIAIIGVLASIVLASLNNARSKSRDAKRATDVKQLQLAEELYFDGQGAGNYTPSPLAVADLVTPGYIPALPVIPAGAVGPVAACNTGYCYSISAAAGAKTTYHLGSGMENNGGVLATDRDCADQVGAAAPICPTAAGATNGFNGQPTVANSTLATQDLFDVVP